jgi:hypothetical protein
MVAMAGIGRAVGSRRRGIMISVCLTGAAIGALLLGFMQVPRGDWNLAGNTSSPPSIVGLRNR